MTTPLGRALAAHIQKGRERFYMPGHKGELPFPFGQCAQFDVTELEGTGCLYDGEGPPAETEEAFAKLYQSGAALLSAGGSTLCIQAMLSLFCPEGSSVIMGRNAHHAAVNAAALLGLEPFWLLPDEPSGVLTGGRVTPAAVQRAIAACPGASAVYITSPDYFGTLCDTAGIAGVCKAYGKPLLVDNAHGAHLKFFEGLHPIEAGADCCCDSLHKTLPALTGGALLHLRDGSLKGEARRRMKQFGSTSPSYLIMLSCDMLLGDWDKLKDGYRALALGAAGIRRAALRRGVWAAGEDALRDPVRITLLFPEGRREEAVKLTRSLGIEAEYISSRHIVLLPAPQSRLSAVEKLVEALPALDEKPALPEISPPKRVMGLRRAALSPAVTVAAGEAAGRIASAPAAPCPPGAALVMPGELIDDSAAAALLRNGVGRLEVVKGPAGG